MRGAYYKKHGAYHEAARWYKQAYLEESKYSSSYRRLDPVLECLEKAGDKAGALEVRKEILRLKSSNANLSTAERESAKKELTKLG